MFDLTRISELLGINSVASYVIIIGLYFVLIYLYREAKTIDNKKIMINTIVVLSSMILLYSFSIGSTELKLSESVDTFEEQNWQVQYKIDAEMELSNYKTEIENTDYYDYNNDVIERIAYSIANEAENSKDAIRKTLQYVYDNVEYVFEDDEKCIQGTAPNIILSGKGQCDTQSISVVSILRKMGIAAKPVGGCYISNPSCKLQSFAMSISPGFGSTPKFNDISDLTDEEILELGRGADVGSRTSLQRSGLHAWVAAWNPESGWEYYEATNGKPIDEVCNYYHIEVLPDESEKEQICKPLTFDYVKACATIDFDNLDAFGIGLTTEVDLK